MQKIEFTVRGNPIAQKRHRSGKFANYDPSSTDKDDFRAAVQHHAPPELITTPVELSLTFNLLRPRTHYGSGKNADKLKDSAPTHCITKPDVDNYIKFIMDALNGVYWKDDSIIVGVRAYKKYNPVPSTTIVIEYDLNIPLTKSESHEETDVNRTGLVPVATREEQSSTTEVAS